MAKDKETKDEMLKVEGTNKIDRNGDLNRLLDLFNTVKIEKGEYERKLMTKEFVEILDRLR